MEGVFAGGEAAREHPLISGFPAPAPRGRGQGWGACEPRLCSIPACSARLGRIH